MSYNVRQWCLKKEELGGSTKRKGMKYGEGDCLPSDDSCPHITQFVLDVGAFYSDLHKLQKADRRNDSKLNRVLARLAKYCNEEFMKIIRRELRY